MTLNTITDFDSLDILFEVASALGTVGLTRGITPYLSVAAKSVIIATMYLGRIGPISLALAVNVNNNGNNHRVLPEESISVG